jgi:hypothetical protein
LAGPSNSNLLHDSMATNATPAIPDVRVLILTSYTIDPFTIRAPLTIGTNPSPNAEAVENIDCPCDIVIYCPTLQQRFLSPRTSRSNILATTSQPCSLFRRCPQQRGRDRC